MELLKNCPICNGENHEKFLMATDNLVTKNEFKIVKCIQCGFIFTNPRPSLEQIPGYYKSDNYSSHSDGRKSLFDRFYAFLRNRNISNKLDLISAYKKENLELFDYGCGVGSFILEAQKRAWKGIGFEPNDDAKKTALKAGLEIKTPEELIAAEARFDLITLWHVLEHIHDINEVISTLKSLLKNNGLLVVAVPNILSWDARHYNEKWAALDVPRHLYHFSEITIEKIFSKFGMEIVNKFPLKMDAYYISLLSEKAPLLKYFMAIIKGWYSNFKARKTINYSSQIFFIKKTGNESNPTNLIKFRV